MIIYWIKYIILKTILKSKLKVKINKKTDFWTVLYHRTIGMILKFLFDLNLEEHYFHQGLIINEITDNSIIRLYKEYIIEKIKNELLILCKEYPLAYSQT